MAGQFQRQNENGFDELQFVQVVPDLATLLNRSELYFQPPGLLLGVDDRTQLVEIVDVLFVDLLNLLFGV